jgi:hypothetical protein
MLGRQPGALTSGDKGVVDRFATQGPRVVLVMGAGEEPGLGPVCFPCRAKQWQQGVRQCDKTISVAFTSTDMDQVTLSIDVAGL